MLVKCMYSSLNGAHNQLTITHGSSTSTTGHWPILTYAHEQCKSPTELPCLVAAVASNDFKQWVSQTGTHIPSAVHPSINSAKSLLSLQHITDAATVDLCNWPITKDLNSPMRIHYPSNHIPFGQYICCTALPSMQEETTTGQSMSPIAYE